MLTPFRPPCKCAPRELGKDTLGQIKQGLPSALSPSLEPPTVELVADRPPELSIKEPRTHRIDFAVVKPLDNLGAVDHAGIIDVRPSPCRSREHGAGSPRIHLRMDIAH